MNNKASNNPHADLKLTEDLILYEDNHLIVINKPAGIATMGTTESTVSLFDLTKQFIKEKYEKPGNVYLGVVSRIDSFVSGVLLFAKTSKAASRLSEQFRAKSVKKSYVAVLEGMLDKSPNVLKSWLRKNDRLKRVESFPRQIEGSQFAELNYDIIKQSGNYTYVQVNLITGRKHQIRCQFSELGTPVFGDRKYDGKRKFGQAIALHAQSMEITHPTTREIKQFVCPIPANWRKNRHISGVIS